MYLYVLVIARDGNKLRQPLAEPHGHIPVHIDSKWFITLLESTYGEVFQGADISTKVHPDHLTHPQTAHWDKTWR